jgi:pyruvate formate-lyase activating enzyme-like uncharacterized protein
MDYISLPRGVVNTLLDAAEENERCRGDLLQIARRLAEMDATVAGDYFLPQLRVVADENADLRDEWPAEALRNLDKSELIMTEIKQVRALNEQLTADLAARDAENARLNKELEMAEADNQALIERTHIQDNRRESQQGYVRHLQSLLEIARQPNKLLLQECAAKDKEIARLRDALEKIAGGEYGGNTFEAYVDAMIEIANEALKEA